MDEFWLASSTGSKIRLTNLHSGTEREVFLLEPATNTIDYLNTSADDSAPPDFVFRTHSRFGYFIERTDALFEHLFTSIGVNGGDRMVAKLKDYNILVSSSKSSNDSLIIPFFSFDQNEFFSKIGNSCPRVVSDLQPRTNLLVEKINLVVYKKSRFKTCAQLIIH